jgi:hypothetical protein
MRQSVPGEYSTLVIATIKAANPDPHYSEKLAPDPH